jgi:hypothetical protein
MRSYYLGHLSRIVAILFFCSLGLVSAQTDMTPLPENPELLLEELEKILTYQNQNEPTEIFETFKKNVKARKITDEHYSAIVRMGNELTKRKMKRFNFFKHLIATINSFSDDATYSAKYLTKYIDISIKVLEDQPEGKQQQYEDYLKFSTYFWVNKNLYQAGATGGLVWRAESQDFNIEYKDKELSIRYLETKLYAYNKTDSLTVHNAKGVYYPATNTWKGDRGRVEWNQDGAQDAYCDIRNYTISMRNTEYTAENATLHYKSVFKMPLEGKVTDRVAKRKPTGMAVPVFESKNRDVRIDDIGQGVSYEGGFALRGSTVRGYGDSQGKSTVYIHDKTNKRIVKATASDFDIIKGERVISDDAQVSVYLYTAEGKLDSIYHPNIRITYNIQRRELELTRGASVASKVPFFNSFQRMEMNASVIKWKIDSTNITLGDDTQDAAFDSETYFDKGLFEKYQPGTTYNYIILFATYSTKLEQHKKELSEAPVVEVHNDQETADADFCATYPEECAKHPTTGKFVPKARIPDPNAPEPDPLLVEQPKEINSLEINANMLARLLDKRVEGREFLTPKEFAAKEKLLEDRFGPKYKMTNNYKELCKRYVDITHIPLLTSVPRSSHDVSNTLRLFFDMVADGFVIMNMVDTTVSLRPKLFHYRNSANTLNTEYDFDRIRIKSVRGDKKKRNKNASLDVTTGNIDVGNVQQFVLSESKKVYAQLDAGGNQATLKEGRDMDFSGDLYAGFFRFTGRSFHFNYKNFEVEMDTIDAIFISIYRRFRYDELFEEEELLPEQKDRYTNLRYYTQDEPSEEDEKPEKVYSTQKVPIRSYIAKTRGVLKIDVAGNKSGRQKHKDGESLPDFDSGTDNPAGFVYYDVGNVQGDGTYPQETFFYQIAAPFVRDSLLSFDPVSWRLKGEFHSASILPVIKDEPLRVMFHDLSLGFEKETPTKDGFPIYLREDEEKGKGVFKGIFGVSNEGLLGKGLISYLGARIESEYIVFLPERFRAENVDSFNLEASTENDVEFPKVNGEQVVIDWAPYSDSMYIETNNAKDKEGVPFKLFDKGEHSLTGSLILTPDGLLGRGTFDWEEGALVSNPGGDFRFGSNKVQSSSTAAIIKSTGLQKFAFQNDDVEADVDFTTRIGDFTSNEKDLSTDLPYNNYKTSLDRFHWKMDEQKILIESTEAGKAGFFLATEQVQDSLFFTGEKADYDLNTGLLRIDGVEYIRVADAFIYPKDQHVEIEERAHMRTLTDSKVVADTANQNHVIQRATVNILSRREYNANGFLEFNVDGHKDQEIKFDNVHVEQIGNNFVTQGGGSVMEDANFYVDKKTRFKGDVNLSANSKDLIFKGYAKLTSEALPTKEWFAIDSKIDKKNVGISFNEPQSPDGTTLFVGIYLNSDQGKVYPAIMAPKMDPADRSVFSVTGVVHYNNKEDAYNFGDSAKVFTDTMAGKKMTVFEKNSKVVAEGRFDFQQGFTRAGMPFVGVEAIGDFSFFLNKQSDVRFDVALNIDMLLPTAVSNFVIQELEANLDIIEPVLYTSMANLRFKRFLFEFIGADRFKKIWKRVEEDNRLNLPNDFAHTFFFNKVTLAWSEKTQSFVSIGTLQLASLAGKHIGQVLQGGIEIIPDPVRGDILNFYIVAPSGEWIYFNYRGDEVKTTSSKSEYTNTITSMKAKDKKLKTSNGENIKIDISNAGEYGAVKNRITNAF